MPSPISRWQNYYAFDEREAAELARANNPGFDVWNVYEIVDAPHIRIENLPTVLSDRILWRVELRKDTR